jgi:hypothetical protein
MTRGTSRVGFPGGRRLCKPAFIRPTRQPCFLDRTVREAQDQFQLRMTFPDSPESMISKAFWNSV